jgi:hypothetical protein
LMMLNMAWSPWLPFFSAKPRGRTSLPRRLNASVGDVETKDPNENRVRIAFSIERNSGIDGDDPAGPTVFVMLADRAGFSRQ